MKSLAARAYTNIRFSFVIFDFYLTDEIVLRSVV